MENLENNKKELLLNFFKSFHNICERENLWYVAECGTLLGAVRNNKMIDWDDDIDLMISLDTYYFLKENFPNNFLDQDTKGYPFTFPKWVPNTKEFLTSNVFIDLFVMIPTTKNRVKKYSKFWNKLRFANQMFNKGTKYKPNDFVGKTLKVCLWPLQWMTKKITFNEIVDILEEKENPEFNLFLNLPTSKIKKEYRSLKTWNREKIIFEDFEIFISKDYDSALKLNYGNDYLIPRKSKNNLIHVDVINTIKRKNKF